MIFLLCICNCHCRWWHTLGGVKLIFFFRYIHKWLIFYCKVKECSSHTISEFFFSINSEVRTWCGVSRFTWSLFSCFRKYSTHSKKGISFISLFLCLGATFQPWKIFTDPFRHFLCLVSSWGLKIRDDTTSNQKQILWRTFRDANIKVSKKKYTESVLT